MLFLHACPVGGFVYSSFIVGSRRKNVPPTSLPPGEALFDLQALWRASVSAQGFGGNGGGGGGRAAQHAASAVSAVGAPIRGDDSDDTGTLAASAPRGGDAGGA